MTNCIFVFCCEEKGKTSLCCYGVLTYFLAVLAHSLILQVIALGATCAPLDKLCHLMGVKI